MTGRALGEVVPRVLGIDGTHPRGWIGVSLQNGRLAACTYRLEFDALLETEPDAEVIAVGLPLGHDDPEGAAGGRRSVDRMAAEILAPGPSHLQAFPPPILLSAADRDVAVHDARSRDWPIPSEAHWLHRDRIKGLMARASEDARLVEAIPEVSFALMADMLGMARPELDPQWKPGRHERLVLLHKAGLRPSRIFGGVGPSVGPYVLLDATAAAWTAERVRRGDARQLGQRAWA